ncbi:MAG: L-threonylcarbamoyladenylate synthase [Chloroflexota bacterium]
MRTRILAPTVRNLDQAAAALRAGALVAFPTDTVYGLAALFSDEAAVARLYAAKERGADKPIALLLAAAEDLPLVAVEVTEVAWRLARRYWPGALTLVVPASERVPPIVRAGGATVGVRVPDHPLARDFIRRAGVPLATTSANRSGQGNLLTAAAVWQELRDRVEYIIEGECPGGVASTVVDLSASPPTILRAGAISPAELAEALGTQF